MSSADRDSEDVGHPLERQVEIVVEHDDGAMIEREPAEASFELIAVDDRRQVIPGRWLLGLEQPDVRRPTPLPSPFRVARVHEKPVRPGLEASRLAQLRKVLPDRDQRLLGRVLGKIEVPQDPARHGEEPVGDLSGDHGVRTLVAALCPYHELGVHAPSTPDGRLVRPPVTRLGVADPRNCQSSSP